MKTQVVGVDDHGHHYKALKFWCPGCENDQGQGGLHMLPVSGDANGKPMWDFDGNTEVPTLSPSILTTRPGFICHSFLKQGTFEFLGDCTHQLMGQKVPVPDLPEWAVKI